MGSWATVFLKAVGILPTTFRNTYADRTTPGNETNIHVACRAGLDQNRIPPQRYYAASSACFLVTNS